MPQQLAAEQLALLETLSLLLNQAQQQRSSSSQQVAL
jgi:hypothetical protein